MHKVCYICICKPKSGREEEMQMERFKKMVCNRWMVLVAAMWVQSCAGIGYVFGSLSPAIKTALRYNQKQINALGVAKDLGDSVGLFAGLLCEVLPTWGMLLMGALQNLLGYGWLWLIVTHRFPTLPFWMICLLIYIGTNGETYFNTAALVSCVRTFPRSRGPIVGILKGFTGLTGAIFTQIYATIYAPDQAAFIFMVAVGPFMVAIAMMFILRPLVTERRDEINAASDTANFNFIYGVCLLLAAYLLGVMLLQDLTHVNHTLTSIFTLGLLIILLLPFALPVISTFFPSWRTKALSANVIKVGTDQLQARLLEDHLGKLPEKVPYTDYVDRHDSVDVLVQDQKSRGLDLLNEYERQKLYNQLESRWFHAAAGEAVSVKRVRRTPRRGEDFTLMQALMKADFWLLFFALSCGGGSGLTIIDNLGQMSESLGYANSHIFVSMISIWNFLGRIGGGFLSEIVAREYAYPRPVTMAAAQIIMAIGQLVFATSWPGCLYGGTLLVGLGYGALWSIVPATASELFGLKNFGSLYNFITMANPAGSLIFSGLVAGTIYDWEAEKQNLSRYPSHSLMAKDGYIHPLKCEGAVCFFLTYLLMAGVCIVGVTLSLVLSYRTKIVYMSMYGLNHHDSEENILKGEHGRKAACCSDSTSGFFRSG